MSQQEHKHLYLQFKRIIETSLLEVFSYVDNPPYNKTQTLDLCVAFSGGLDSSVLLDLCHRMLAENQQSKTLAFKFSISATHVNHGISQYANEWQSHCQSRCNDLGIPLNVVQCKVIKRAQKSLEADAREVRYNALDASAKKNSIVLLAQHQDDQAETLLLQLSRGAGLKGLASMPSRFTRTIIKSNQAHPIWYFRPLLNISRSELLAYAQTQGLAWVEDESNQDSRYDRNFLRNKIFPLLELRWPAISKTIARSAKNCAEAVYVNKEYMALLSDQLCELSPMQLLHEKVYPRINVKGLLQKSTETQKSFLRYYLNEQININPSSVQLSNILDICQKPKHRSTNNSPVVIFKQFALEKYKDFLHIIELTREQIEGNSEGRRVIDCSTNTICQLNEYYVLTPREASLAPSPTSNNPSNNVIEILLPAESVKCVFAGSNIVFKWQANRPSKKMKDWYKEWGISPLKRQQVPVFFKDNRVVAVGLGLPLVTCDLVESENLQPFILAAGP